MPNTDISSDDNIGASFVATSFALCSMSKADSSPLDLVGASIMAACFHLCSVPHTDPSLHSIVGASLMITSFARFLCAMPYADSSLDDNIGAPVVATFFYFCTVPNAFTSLLGIVATSIVAAFLSRSNHRSMLNTDATFHDAIFAAIDRAQPTSPLGRRGGAAGLLFDSCFSDDLALDPALRRHIINAMFRRRALYLSRELRERTKNYKRYQLEKNGTKSSQHQYSCRQNTALRRHDNNAIDSRK